MHVTEAIKKLISRHWFPGVTIDGCIRPYSDNHCLLWNERVVSQERIRGRESNYYLDFFFRICITRFFFLLWGFIWKEEVFMYLIIWCNISKMLSRPTWPRPFCLDEIYVTKWVSVQLGQINLPRPKAKTRA